MSQLYTGELRQTQDLPEHYFDSVNILDDELLDAEYLGLRQVPAETAAFLDRFPDADPEKLKWAIITLWEGSPWQEKVFEAPTAIYWLQITGHISAEQRVTSPDNFLRLWVQRERERAAGLAPVAFSEPFAPLSQTDGGACNG